MKKENCMALGEGFSEEELEHLNECRRLGKQYKQEEFDHYYRKNDSEQDYHTEYDNGDWGDDD